jgi:hypothetical protein
MSGPPTSTAWLGEKRSVIGDTRADLVGLLVGLLVFVVLLGALKR